MSGESVVSSAVPAATTRTTSFKGSSPSSKYVKLNVGGALYYTTMQTLTKQDTMLKAMFSGRMEVLTDSEGKCNAIACFCRPFFGFQVSLWTIGLQVGFWLTGVESTLGPFWTTWGTASSRYLRAGGRQRSCWPKQNIIWCRGLWTNVRQLYRWSTI